VFSDDLGIRSRPVTKSDWEILSEAMSWRDNVVCMTIGGKEDSKCFRRSITCVFVCQFFLFFYLFDFFCDFGYLFWSPDTQNSSSVEDEFLDKAHRPTNVRRRLEEVESVSGGRTEPSHVDLTIPGRDSCMCDLGCAFFNSDWQKAPSFQGGVGERHLSNVLESHDPYSIDDPRDTVIEDALRQSEIAREYQRRAAFSSQGTHVQNRHGEKISEVDVLSDIRRDMVLDYIDLGSVSTPHAVMEGDALTRMLSARQKQESDRQFPTSSNRIGYGVLGGCKSMASLASQWERFDSMEVDMQDVFAFFPKCKAQASSDDMTEAHCKLLTEKGSAVSFQDGQKFNCRGKPLRHIDNMGKSALKMLSQLYADEAYFFFRESFP